jgi:hypothetical protein
MVEVGQSIIVIKDVPSQVCEQCGEISYSDEVARHLERIIAAIKATMKSTAVTIVNYADQAA